jgi:nucleoside-diphosphate-sugar epimerase
LKILITGGTGYIGGQMARYLDAEGFDIVCMTRQYKSVGHFPTVEGDLLQPDSLPDALEGIDIVCHFAGALGRGLTDEMVYAVNVTGLKNILTAARQKKIKYFLHISSGAVTGPMGPEPANEKTECHPYTIYERTKLEGERLALSFSKETGLPLGVARPTFTYGPGDPHKLLMFKYVQKGWFFYIGDGRSTNHPVYIDDLLKGLLLMIQQQPIQEVYILGGPRPVSKREWASAIAEALNVRPPWFCFPARLAWLGANIMEMFGRLLGVEVPLTRSRVLAMSRYWGMDIQKARDDLGYNPVVELRQGVARTIAWYRDSGLLQG